MTPRNNKDRIRNVEEVNISCSPFISVSQITLLIQLMYLIALEKNCMYSIPIADNSNKHDTEQTTNMQIFNNVISTTVLKFDRDLSKN